MIFLIKQCTLTLMFYVKDTRFLPDALPCLSSPNKHVRNAARQYLNAVGHR